MRAQLLIADRLVPDGLRGNHAQRFVIGVGIHLFVIGCAIITGPYPSKLRPV